MKLGTKDSGVIFNDRLLRRDHRNGQDTWGRWGSEKDRDQGIGRIFSVNIKVTKNYWGVMLGESDGVGVEM